jgi:hypothetical protein
VRLNAVATVLHNSTAPNPNCTARRSLCVI